MDIEDDIEGEAMTVEQYLVALYGANSSDEVLDLQREYDDTVGVHLRPIGGIENNSYSMENMEKVTRAHNETITNGYDSLIQLHQHLNAFSTNPKTPSEAQDEIATHGLKAPGVYVFTGTPTEKRAPQGGRPKHLANVTTVDEGIGIKGNFGDNIMSIGGSNKVSNPLSMGTYGQGCKAILGFSKDGVALIASRHVDDPDHIYFTVASMIERPNWKAASYQWQHDGNGQALRARVANLPLGFLIEPSIVDGKNVIEMSNGHLILGDHGLSFRAYELTEFSSPLVVFNQFRENNFGLAVPLRYRNGIGKSPFKAYERYKQGDLVQIGAQAYQANADFKASGKFDIADWSAYEPKNVYNIRGLRYRLLANNSPSYPVEWQEIDVPILHDDLGKPQATISAWYVEERAGKVKRTHDKLDKPVYSMLSKPRWHTPVFVTMHGQTHLTLPILTRLRSAELPYLDGHMIIEVKCDIMDAEFKRQMFTSNREGAKEGMRDRLNEEIEAYLKVRGVEGGQLRNYHDALRTKAASQNIDPADKMAQLKRFMKLMRNPLAGSLFASMGFGGSKRRERRPNDPNYVKPIFTGKSIPDKVSMIGEISFEPGQKRYLSVATNAINAFDVPQKLADGSEVYPITLTLPPFLRVLNRMPIDNGRVSFRVECDPTANYGDSGDFVGTVDLAPHGLAPLEAKGKITVAKERERKKDKGVHKTVLNPILRPVDGDEGSRWGSMQVPDGVRVADVAFAWEKIGGDVEILWNTKFGPYTDTLDAIQSKWRKETGVVDRFKADYQMAMQFLAFAEIDGDIAAPTDEDAGNRHGMRAAAAKVQAFMLFTGLDSMLSGPTGRGRRKDVEIVVEEEAEASTADSDGGVGEDEAMAA